MTDGNQLSGFERRRRDLPHWEEPGATYAVRFSVRQALPVDLTRPELAGVIVQALQFHDARRYWLYDYTVMPCHVHAILKPIVHDGQAEHLWRIMGDLKGWTSRQINDLLGRRGPFWRDESHDRLIRDKAEYEEWASYIFENPRTAGLVEDPLDWPWWGKGSGR